MNAPNRDRCSGREWHDGDALGGAARPRSTTSTYSTLYVFKKIVLFFGTHSHTVLYIAKAK